MTEKSERHSAVFWVAIWNKRHGNKPSFWFLCRVWDFVQFLGSILDTENTIKTILKQDEVTIDTEEALNHFEEVIDDPSISSVEHLTQVVGSSQKSLEVSMWIFLTEVYFYLSKTTETKVEPRLRSLMQS